MIPADRLVLGTSAYSHLRAGHRGVLEHVASAAVVVVPVPVLGELEAGFILGRRTDENRRVLAEFLDEPFVTVHDVTPSTAQHYGKIFSGLRRSGTPIPLNDIWIAAATIECSGHLLTFDTDYFQVAELARTVLDAPT